MRSNPRVPDHAERHSPGNASGRNGAWPILKRQPGFKGYYVVRLEDGGGGSISLFDNADTARAAHQQALSWITGCSRFVRRPPALVTSARSRWVTG